MYATSAIAMTGRNAGQQPFQVLFPWVRAARGCTQEDAPAVEIYFFGKETAAGELVAPYVRVEISGLARERIPPTTYHLMPLRRDSNERRRIVRAELVDKLGSSTWLGGTITIGADEPDTRIIGRVNLISPKGEAWDRAFSAQYLTKRALCG